MSSSAHAVVLAILALPGRLLALPGRLRALVGWILAAAAAAAVPLPAQIAAVAGDALALPTPRKLLCHARGPFS